MLKTPSVKPKVLITKRIYPEAVDLVQQHCEVDYVDNDEGLPRESLLRRAQGKQAVISQLTDKLTPEVIPSLNGVRIIANVAAGYDNINVDAATKAGILVSNTPDVLTETTADLAFALLMVTARRIVEAHQYIQAGKWRKWSIDLLVGHEVHNRTLGIIGMGRIGQAVARRGLGFSMRILYHDASGTPRRLNIGLDAQPAPLDVLLAESDFISLHVPLSYKTRKMIGARELQLMKPTAILINSARGAVVDEAALVEALRNGVIAGAGLDVFENEPQVHPGLLDLPQAVLAPHIGSASIDTRRNMSLIAAKNVVEALEGRCPPNLVNAQLWERLRDGKEA